MWQFLVAAVVAGSTGFVAKHFLTQRNDVEVENADLHGPSSFVFSASESTSQTRQRHGVFTFSSSRSPTQQDGPKSRRSRASRNGVRVELRSAQRSGGRRLRFCLKKNKITKNVAAKADNSLFGWGLCIGIMCMMSAGKAEINKLNKTVDETAKLVQELKAEINRRKSSRGLQNLDSVGNDVKGSRKISGKNEVTLKNTVSEIRNTDVIIWSPGVNDCGECGSSALTEEPEPQVLEMDQLEAELELELQKLSGCTTDGPCHEKTKPNLDEIEAPDEGCHLTDDWNLSYSNSHGVSASELHQKLSHLLIKQQENQIMELESELQQAQSNLHEKEAELQELKDRVKRLTELSLSTISDEETQVLTDPKGTSDYGNNYIDSELKHSVVGTKRPIDFESCLCYM
ncbi:uncharacterized protein LOC109805165 [Cajanus cajan]|uniref:uncharacterized protein LOC109805165 n=2 Tax=Cajanus cajan TaxID=3821 RepID=UPI00098D9F4A|nr:uncharacterized protein LOC109805165 [Cajanus cajan]